MKTYNMLHINNSNTLIVVDFILVRWQLSDITVISIIAVLIIWITGPSFRKLYEKLITRFLQDENIGTIVWPTRYGPNYMAHLNWLLGSCQGIPDWFGRSNAWVAVPSAKLKVFFLSLSEVFTTMTTSARPISGIHWPPRRLVW